MTMPRKQPPSAANTHPCTVPPYVDIAGWSALSSMSRSGTYRALRAGHLRAVKVGGRTLIDAPAGLAWLARLPSAEFAAAE
jgi:hypothetical protein